MGKQEENANSSGAERPVLAVTCGDPCGIGPEIVLKAAANKDAIAVTRLLVVGDEALLRRTARQLKLRWPFSAVVKQPPTGRRWEKPQLLDLANVDEGGIPGQISVQAGRAAGEYIETATRLALEHVVDGIVTAPVHKQALSLAGHPDNGHTEMLARLSGLSEDSVGMMFHSERLSVGLLTTHLPIRDALRKVRSSRVVRMLKLFDREWQRLIGSRPRIAVAALNPHAGEGGRFGVEESRYLIPAVERARRDELLVWDPLPADSVFVRAIAGEFDLVLALYHDQATIPVKLLEGQESVNVTVGLPFVRTSVDHGTAMDIAGKGIARPESMIEAIRVGARFSKRVARERGDDEGQQ